MSLPAVAEKFRVLLVEDNPGDVFLLREMVETEPNSRFNVRHAVGTLREGIALMQAGEADLTLLDLSLPDGGGLSTFSRAHEAAPELPIIVLSGRDDEELVHQHVPAWSAGVGVGDHPAAVL